jgi:phosphatidate cytidylyltransferase
VAAAEESEWRGHTAHTRLTSAAEAERVVEPVQPEPAPAPPPEPRRGPGRNLPVAIATGLVLLGMVVGSLILNPLAFVAVLAVIVLAALVELLTVLRERGFKPAEPVVYLVAAIVVLGAWRAGTAALSLGILVALLAAFGWYLLDRNRAQVTRNVAITVFACVYVPFTAAHLVLVVRETPHYVWAVISYGLLVSCYDTFAYAVGSTLGRRLLAPNVSPSKSVEGAVGATIATLAFGAFLLPLAAPWTLASGLTMAVVTCIIGPIGDLAESMLKRDLAVKDMGFLLPGHGGFLDRIDALLLVAPALYYVLALYGGGR